MRLLRLQLIRLPRPSGDFALSNRIKSRNHPCKQTLCVRKIDTVYIGGGTPSALDERQITSVFESLENAFDLSCVKEYSIECNPESITDEKLAVYKQHGVRRVSIGVQSLSDNNLKAIGRLHTAKVALDKIRLAKEYFDNVSCDLIVGLPFDTEDVIREEVQTLCPVVDHISMYELSVEKGTRLEG